MDIFENLTNCLKRREKLPCCKTINVANSTNNVTGQKFYTGVLIGPFYREVVQ